MTESYYTSERNHQILISLLKEHNIKKIIASPGTANSIFIGSIQNDSFFEIYSAADERSAAYIACGLAAESNEPVVISCTGATASRNYMPGLTEAFYSKLPILAITSSQETRKVGHLIPQVTNRTSPPPDVVKRSVILPLVNTTADEWECELLANLAILELVRGGAGPVHIDLITPYTYNSTTALTQKQLPSVKKIQRFSNDVDNFPLLPKGRVGIFVGSHKRWTDELTKTVEEFCKCNNAVVFCDHTSGYKGKYRQQYPLLINQSDLIISGTPIPEMDVLIHIGEVSGEEGAITRFITKETWRISEDGELRDTFRKLRYVFEMEEVDFFKHYVNTMENIHSEFYDECQKKQELLQTQLHHMVGGLPLSNPWIAANIAQHLPENSTLHLSILNSLRTWNYFPIPDSVYAYSPVGGFGIDGSLSMLLGTSLAAPDRLHFAIVGDLAFFYDMNALGNRHIMHNVRILLVNNGEGFEFKKSYAAAYRLLGDAVESYVSAKGHYGNKSPNLVKSYAENLGYEYISAKNKDEFLQKYKRFITPEITEKPIIFEVFTSSDDERNALDMLHHCLKPYQSDDL